MNVNGFDQNIQFKHTPTNMKNKGKTHSTSKPSKSKKPTSSHKKKKSKNLLPPPDDYIILDGNIYQANTHSERAKYTGFIHNIKINNKIGNGEEVRKVKKKSIEMKYTGCWGQGVGGSLKKNEANCKPEQENEVNLEDYVRKMTKQQKVEMLKKLEKQIKVNPHHRSPRLSQPASKLQKLSEKLQGLRTQLTSKWEFHVEKLNAQLEQKQISKHEHKEKIYMINKMKDQKLKVIDCTKSLFENILGDDTLKKSAQIEDILKKLNSLSSFQQIPLDVESARHSESQSNSIKSEIEFEKVSEQIQKKQEEQVVVTEENQAPGFRIISEESLLLSPQSPEKIDTAFQCDEMALSKKLKIPLLMTKEKVEQIEADKKAKQANKLKEEIEKRVSFQMSEVEDTENYFTTLAGLNGYIMQLYEFVINVDLEKVVEKLNFPFGKSVRDKLCSLQESEDIDQFQLYPVLEESLFSDYNKQLILNVRKVPEFQKIHNKAVFDCFNTNLNAYRPYYELEGQVYPWAVSQKGITFYQINQDNIEQVFQKTKIKTLQYASSLCGLIPDGCKEELEVLKQKRQELSSKQQKIALIEEFHKWQVKLVNVQAYIRLKVCEGIFEKEIVEAVLEMQGVFSHLY